MLVIHDDLDVDVSRPVIGVRRPASSVAGPTGHVALIVIVEAFR
jgi:hypothetical protein